jgi:hypothetical protein
VVAGERSVRCEPDLCGIVFGRRVCDEPKVEKRNEFFLPSCTKVETERTTIV